MKLRNGFVSNSSSSSFVIKKKHITIEQYEALIDFCSLPIGKWDDSWSIDSDAETVSGFTIMNNNGPEPGGLEDWMKNNGFPMDKVKWEND